MKPYLIIFLLSFSLALFSLFENELLIAVVFFVCVFITTFLWGVRLWRCWPRNNKLGGGEIPSKRQSLFLVLALIALSVVFQVLITFSDSGVAIAENGLGICYLKGVGVSMDKEEAAKWFRRAAAQGHEGAKQQLLLLERNNGALPSKETAPEKSEK